MIQGTVVLLTLWVGIATLNSLLNAINRIYESRETFSGVSIQGYMDLVKLLLVIIGIILSIAIITGQSPLLLLSGLGALTAVLLLIFRDTLLSFVASIQISTQDLVKQGDWIEVPSFSADGDVIDMTLHNIVIQNWDKTISVVPTYKLLDTPYRNWRGMSESGGRRMKRALNIDLRSIRFLTEKEITELKRIDLLKDYLERKQKELAEHNTRLRIDETVPVNGRRLTNIGTFRAYVEAYVRRHPALHQEGMTLLVRQLAPSPQGLPIEVYAFTKSTVWAEYEAIQADVFDHLIAAVPHFGLKVHQEVSGELGAV
jgi:miniconductance mechanosensitive channel